MTLVSIRSEEELRFIKYLLRENRYRHKQPMATFDKFYTIPSYWTHIGINAHINFISYLKWSRDEMILLHVCLSVCLCAVSPTFMIEF